MRIRIRIQPLPIINFNILVRILFVKKFFIFSKIYRTSSLYCTVLGFFFLWTTPFFFIFALIWRGKWEFFSFIISRYRTVSLSIWFCKVPTPLDSYGIGGNSLGHNQTLTTLTVHAGLERWRTARWFGTRRRGTPCSTPSWSSTISPPASRHTSRWTTSL